MTDAAPDVQLDAAELKRRRERARRAAKKAAAEAFERSELERLKAEAPPVPADQASPAPAPTPSAGVATGRTDDELAASAAAFLSGVAFPVLAFLAAWFTPWKLAPLTPEQAAEDGRAWVAPLRRYETLARLVLWAAPFAGLVSRVRQLASRKDATA